MVSRTSFPGATDARRRQRMVVIAVWTLAPWATPGVETGLAAESTGVVRASPAGAEDGAVVPAGGLIAARRAAQCGGTCGRADCQKCRAAKGCRHHGACGPEVPGCPAHCPVRPDRFGYYQTNWRRWPGQTVVPAAYDDAAVPVSPPRSVVPGPEDEAGSAPDDGDTEMKSELPGPVDAATPEPTAKPGDTAPVIEPETPAETPADPAAPRNPTKPGKPDDELFEQSRVPRRTPEAAADRMAQWRAKRRVPGSTEPAGAVLASGSEPTAAANLPAAIEAPGPANPFRR